MNPIKKLILATLGAAALGLITYYLVNEEAKPKAVVKKPVKNAEKKPVATAKAIQDSLIVQVTRSLQLEGESFTPTQEEGVFTNATKDKLLVLKEDIWKKIIRAAKRSFPEEAEDCAYSYPEPDLSDFEFVGLLTYYGSNDNTEETTAYSAQEVRKGNLVSFAGGGICCGCNSGEPLVPQKVDAVVIKK
jgi:hypothetical protein